VQLVFAEHRQLVVVTEQVKHSEQRKLGEAVGVEAMSLYNHVANKGDLLDGMIDVVFSEIDLPSARTAGGRPCVGVRSRFALSCRVALSCRDILWPSV